MIAGQQRRGTLFRDALRFRWPIIVAAVVVGTALGVLLSLQRPPSFVSTARVLINPLVGNPYTPERTGDDLVSLQTEAEVVTSDPIGSEAADIAGLPETSSLLSSGVRVTVPANTQILDISVTGKDKAEVADAADALATAYLESREALAQDVVETQSNKLEQQIASTEARLAEAQQAAENGPVNARQTQRRIADSAQADLYNLRALQTEVENTATDPGRITEPAQEGAAGSALTRLLLLLVGVLGGCLVGLYGALTRERSTGLVRTPSELTALGIHVLGNFVGKDARRGQGEEPLRRMRSEILSSITPPAVVAICAASSEEQSSALARGLATSLAVLDHKSIYVSTDGREVASSNGASGLSEAVLDREDPTTLLLPVVGKQLSYLPAGKESVAAREHFVSPLFTDVIFRLRRSRAFIFLAAPPVLQTDGEAAAAAADVVILVVVANHTTIDQVQAATTLLAVKKVRLLGVAFVPAVLRVPDRYERLWSGPVAPKRWLRR